MSKSSANRAASGDAWFDDLPPRGPHNKAQSTNLSEGRWIDLTLTIDGQGLLAELSILPPNGVAPVADLSEEEQESAALLLEEAAALRRILSKPPRSCPATLSSIRRRPTTAKIGPRLQWLRPGSMNLCAR